MAQDEVQDAITPAETGVTIDDLLKKIGAQAMHIEFLERRIEMLSSFQENGKPAEKAEKK